MKTLKFLLAVFIMFGFAANAMHAQPIRSSNYETWYIDCTGEEASGWLQSQWLENGHKWQNILTGELIGTSGTVYRFHGIFENSFNANENNLNGEGTYTAAIMIFANNKLIETLHNEQHVTVNANGEITVWKEKPWISICH